MDDGDTLSYTATAQYPGILGASVTGTTASINALNPAPHGGSSTVTYKATDGYGGYATSEMSFTVTANVTRSVSERASGGAAVGAPVTGKPYDDGDAQTDDALTHTLTGEATDAFVIDAATGQITVAQGATLDHDTKDSYTGKVEYTVQGQAAVVNLTIKVTDVHPPLTPEAPSVTGSATDPTDTLDVGWTEPDTSGNRPITDYDVRYRVVGADGWTQHPIAAAGTV